MEEKKQRFAAWMGQEKEKCVQEEKSLIGDERKDEANLCKVRANMYHIFSVLLEAAESRAAENGRDVAAERGAGKSGRDEAGLQAVFLEKARHVSQSWKESYETAKEHQDVEKILIEETKLATAEKIVNKFQEIWEE